MSKTIVDLMGQRFGKLIVIEFCGTGNETHKRAQWKCSCECGNTVIMASCNLRSGRVVGCGKCRVHIVNQHGKYDLRDYDSAFMLFYRATKQSASNRNLTFNLGVDDVKMISGKDCFYCGVSPKQVLKVRNRFGKDYVYNGIDRVDNTKGYTLDNCVPCCKKCNQAKMNLPVEQFKSLIVSIYNNWASH